jgi:hypothetical protein
LTPPFLNLGLHGCGDFVLVAVVAIASQSPSMRRCGIVSKIRDNALTTRCERVIRAEAALKAKVWRRKGRPKAIEPRDIEVPGT